MARVKSAQRLVVAVRSGAGRAPGWCRPARSSDRSARLGEIGDRVAVAADPRIGRAAGVVGAGIVRVALDHVGQRGDVDACCALACRPRPRRSRRARAAARGFAAGQRRGRRAPGPGAQHGASMRQAPCDSGRAGKAGDSWRGEIASRRAQAMNRTRRRYLSEARIQAQTRGPRNAISAPLPQTGADPRRSDWNAGRRRRGAAGRTRGAPGRPAPAAATGRGFEGSRPSRCMRLRISLRARRTASAFSRAFFSEGFS